MFCSYINTKYLLSYSFKNNMNNSLKNNLKLCIRKNGTQMGHHNFWIEPEGCETDILIYNSLSKSKVPFKTLLPDLVTWYNCGPTVYDTAHLGHALCYVRFDIIRRIMQDVFQMNVIQVTGITDVDDKIIKRAQEMNISVSAVSLKYEKEFLEDMKKLNVLSADLTPRVTDHIPQIISFITKIMDRGLAYKLHDGSVYFNTSSYSGYGKFIKQSDNELQQNIFDPGKVDPRHFALWKGLKEGEGIYWESPWGPGRPGWHIECSAIASHIFGNKLDLHSGGIDLVFPHHENEEAQCCAHHDSKQWCNYWIHSGHLISTNCEKMSKSLKNTVCIDKFLQNHCANALRMICLLSNYRSSVELTSNLIERSENSLRKFNSFFQDSLAFINGTASFTQLDQNSVLQKFMETRKIIKIHLADDFDTKQAMLSLLELIHLFNKELKQSRVGVKSSRSICFVVLVREYIRKLLTNLGLTFDGELLSTRTSAFKDENFEKVLNSAVQFRRNIKNLALQSNAEAKQETSANQIKSGKLNSQTLSLLKACDTFRQELSEEGIQVKDYAGDSSWSFETKKKRSHEQKKES